MNEMLVDALLLLAGAVALMCTFTGTIALLDQSSHLDDKANKHKDSYEYLIYKVKSWSLMMLALPNAIAGSVLTAVLFCVAFGMPLQLGTP